VLKVIPGFSGALLGAYTDEPIEPLDSRLTTPPPLWEACFAYKSVMVCAFVTRLAQCCDYEGVASCVAAWVMVFFGTRFAYFTR
jgi:hypothetical protein